MTLLSLLLDFRIWGIKLVDTEDFSELLIRFIFNLLISFIVVFFIYRKKQPRSNYPFTFLVVNVLIFFVCYIMDSAEIEIGFAFGLFAIFSILRYRTQNIPVREMTYLFVVIALAVLNALSTKKVSYAELLFTNFAILGILYFIDISWIKQSPKSLIIDYDVLDDIQPEKKEELLVKLNSKTGLNIIDVEISSVDLLRDCAKLKVYLEDNV